MSSTSQKHRDFVSESMGGKPIYAVPGAGPVIGGRLYQQGYSSVRDIVGY